MKLKSFLPILILACMVSGTAILASATGTSNEPPCTPVVSPVFAHIPWHHHKERWEVSTPSPSMPIRSVRKIRKTPTPAPKPSATPTPTPSHTDWFGVTIK
jgi:hypothetical protein